jgi:hypothetical protein
VASDFRLTTAISFVAACAASAGMGAPAQLGVPPRADYLESSNVSGVVQNVPFRSSVSLICRAGDSGGVACANDARGDRHYVL